MEFEIAHMLQ